MAAASVAYADEQVWEYDADTQILSDGAWTLMAKDLGNQTLQLGLGKDDRTDGRTGEPWAFPAEIDARSAGRLDLTGAIYTKGKTDDESARWTISSSFRNRGRMDHETRCLSVLLACAASASDAAVSPFRWEPLYGPGCGGAIVSVAVSPHDSRHVVSGGDMLGTAVSFDGGESWTPGLGLPSYEMATPTFHTCVAFDSERIVAGTCGGGFITARWPTARASRP